MPRHVVYQSRLDRVQIMSNATEGTYRFMTTPHRAINSVESKNTPLVQKYLGLVVEYLEKGKLHSSSGRPRND